MKKFTSVFMAILLCSMLALTAMAGYEQGALVENAGVAFEAKQATVAQAFDGVITEGEYYLVDVSADMRSYAWDDAGDDGSKAKAINFDYYLAWDDNGVRTAIVYKAGQPYENLYTPDDAGNMWNRTAAQVSFAPITDDTMDILELGFGRNSADGSQLNFTWLTPVTGTGHESTAGKDYSVTLAGNGDLVYEIFVPWTAFLAGNAKLGDSFGTVAVAAGGTEELGHSHSQIAAGCTGDPGKNATLFAKVKLVEAPPAPVTDPPAEGETPAAPQTHDMSVAMIAVMLISAAAAAVVLKKKSSVK